MSIDKVIPQKNSKQKIIQSNFEVLPYHYTNEIHETITKMLGYTESLARWKSINILNEDLLLSAESCLRGLSHNGKKVIIRATNSNL